MSTHLNLAQNALRNENAKMKILFESLKEEQIANSDFSRHNDNSVEVWQTFSI